MHREILQAILDCYPELDVQTLRVIDSGQVNMILIVNESLVFRFPKTASGVNQLLTELAVLRIIQGRLPIAVPEPVYISTLSGLPGKVFAGHPMVSGEPLGKHIEALKALPSTQLDAIADDLADFMHALHGMPVPSDVSARLPNHSVGRKQNISVLRNQVDDSLTARLLPEYASRVFAQFERFLGDSHNFDFAPALRHGDLGPGNVLVDPHTFRLSGVIDFGAAGLDDPATDLGFVLLWGMHLFGASFAERVLARYGADDALRTRAGFFHMAIALTVALGGLESGNQNDLDFGLAAL